MLPGVADPAEHLDALLGAPDRGVDRHHRGHTGGELALPPRAARPSPPGPAPSGPAVPGSVVPGSARAASQTAAAACSAAVSIRAQRCFTAWNWPIGRPNWWRILAYSLAARVAQSAMPDASAPNRIAARLVTARRSSPVSSRSAGTTARSARTRATGRVRSRLSSAGDVEAAGVDRGPDLAVLGLHREDDEVGQAGAEHRAGLAVDDQGRPGVPRLAGPGGSRAARGLPDAGQARGQADRARPGPVGQAGDQLAGHPGRGQDRAGQHGRQEVAGHQRAAEFLHGHGQLGQAVALPAVLLRQVQPEQALLGQARRERLAVVGRPAVRPVGGGPDDVRRAVPLRPAPDGLGQLQVLFGQAERHGSPRGERPLAACRNSRTRFGFTEQAPDRPPRRPGPPTRGGLAEAGACWREWADGGFRSGRRGDAAPRRPRRPGGPGCIPWPAATGSPTHGPS